jgi:hypothetical protein
MYVVGMIVGVCNCFVVLNNSVALTALRHQRNVYYEVAKTLMTMMTPVPSSLSSDQFTKITQIVCIYNGQWVYGDDTIFGANTTTNGDKSLDLVFGNMAILGVYLKSNASLSYTPIASGIDTDVDGNGNDMLTPIRNAFGRAVDTSRYYDTSYFVSSLSCMIRPGYQKAILQDYLVHLQEVPTLYLPFASTAITFDSDINGGDMLVDRMLSMSYDVTNSCHPPFAPFSMNSTTRDLLDATLAFKLAKLKWLWNDATSASVNALLQSSVVDVSTVTTGTCVVYPTHNMGLVMLMLMDSQ